jgi:hypothetical protein
VQLPASSSPESSSRLPVDLRRFPSVRRLAIDYVHGFERLAPFFSGDPRVEGAWPAAIMRARAVVRNREGLFHVLRQQQQQRGAPPAARAAAERLAEPDSVAVVTGQQAGLFGGPLYTLLKAWRRRRRQRKHRWRASGSIQESSVRSASCATRYRAPSSPTIC